MIRGRQLAVIDGAVLGSDEEGAEMLAGTAGARPEIDTFGRVPASPWSACTWTRKDRRPAVSARRCSTRCPTPRSTRSWPRSVRAPDHAAVVELRQLGGALARPHEGGGALSQPRRGVRPVRCRHRGHAGDGHAGTASTR